MSLKYHFTTIMVAFFGLNFGLQAQDSGRFSGDVNLNLNFYERDTIINASGNSLYDNLKSGGESWMSLNYTRGTLDVGLRFDLYLNSNRIFPNNDYSEQGIGNWYIKKKLDKLTLTGGYFYDQFGSGAVFRAFEERLLGIDKSVLGIKAEYELTDQIFVKAFMGKQKFLFELSPAFLKGINAEAFYTIDKINLNPGISVVNRTLDAPVIQNIADAINLLPLSERFVPQYNVYSASFYNTLSAGKFDWFVEYAFKTNEAINTSGNLWEDLNGNFFYSTLSYAEKGLGITLQTKRTENFSHRTNPLELVLQNNVTFNVLPAINREHSTPLLTSYNAQALEFDEFSFTADFIINPQKRFQIDYLKGYTFQLSFSNISNLNLDSLYYREYFAEVEIQKPKSPWKFHGAIQVLDYNQTLYEQKGKFINSLIPSAEVIYKIDKKTALRFEGEYQLLQRKTRFKEGFDAELFKQDRNDWVNALLELTISPNWSFAVSDMYNVNPPDEDMIEETNILQQHFYGFFTSYSHKSNKFSLFYGKRADGIVCSGGVCRYEPAFSGLQFQLSSSF